MLEIALIVIALALLPLALTILAQLVGLAASLLILPFVSWDNFIATLIYLVPLAVLIAVA